MDDIMKSYHTKKTKLINYVNVLLTNERKKQQLLSSLTNKQKLITTFYNQQLKMLDNERDRLIRSLPLPSKKACLVGINYTGTTNELLGCVNDVYIIRDLLVSQYKYKLEDIQVLTDQHATRENILQEFTSLVQQAKSGDSICFTFSGHGSYFKDRNNEEADGQDELIVSVDNRAIVDDEFKIILDTHLNPGVNMFTLFDSCHSGTVLDLKYSFDNNITTVINESYKETKGNVVLLCGCRDNQVSIDGYINNSFNGILSSAFVYILRNNPSLTWNELLTKMREILLLNQLTQVPQICSGNNQLIMCNSQVNI